MFEHQGQLAIDAAGKRNAVRAVLGGGEAESRSAEQTRVEVDLSRAIFSEFLFDGICGMLDRGQRGRIDEPAEAPVGPQDMLSHFGAIVCCPHKRFSLRLETQRTVELDHRIERSILRLFIGREHAHDETLGSKCFFKSHIDCLPRYFIAYLLL